jgi:hypothetical protein
MREISNPQKMDYIVVKNYGDLKYGSVVSYPHTEPNDCAIRALAAVTNMEYTEALSYGRLRWNKTFKRGIRLSTIVEDLLIKKPTIPFRFKAVGDSEVTVKYRSPNGTIVHLPKPGIRKGDKLSTLTVNQFLKNYTYGRYIIIVRGHAMAVVDGMLIGNNDDIQHLRRPVSLVIKVNYSF